MKIEFEWEHITPRGRSYRVKVYGGWIVSDTVEEGTSMVFVPDPEHQWEI